MNAPVYVNDLDIPARVKNALADNGYTLVAKVREATDGQLCRIPNLGTKGVRDLRHAISIFDPAPTRPSLDLKPIQDAVWIAADIRGFRMSDTDTEILAFAAVEALRDYTDGMPNFMKEPWQERMNEILRGVQWPRPPASPVIGSMKGA